MGDGAAATLFSCNYYDLEEVTKIVESLHSGLAAACVGNTMGDLFNSPASVAEKLRKKMVTYLEQQSKACVARKKMIRYIRRLNTGYAAILESSNSECPIHAGVDDLIEKFVHGERNLFARICACSTILIEQQEHKIDCFAYQMDKMGLWVISEREVFAKKLLKVIDLNNTHHCEMKFESQTELQLHKNLYCVLRPVNCPFYRVGCMSVIPEASIKKHCEEFLQSHSSQVLQYLREHEQELTMGDLAQPSLPQSIHNLLEKSVSMSESERSEAVDIPSLCLIIKKKKQEAKMKGVHVILGQDVELAHQSAQLSQLRAQLLTMQSHLK